MPFIGNQPALSYTSFAVQHFTTSATTSYTLDYSVANENEIRLVINNVVQQPGSSYAYTASGTTLTLSAATSATDTMYAVFLGKAVQTVTPASGSVTNAMLGETITVAKGGTGVTTSADLANTGNLVLLSSATLSGDTEVVFNNSIITSTYKSYIIRAVEVHTSDDNVACYFRVSDDNGSSYKSSDYKISIHVLVINLNNNTYISRQASSAQGTIAGMYEGIGNDTGEALNFELQLFNPLASADTQLMVKSLYQSNNGRQTLNNGFGVHGTSTSVNNIKIYPASGNFAEGTISIYGVKT
jgi:hypothetical protein